MTATVTARRFGVGRLDRESVAPLVGLLVAVLIAGGIDRSVGAVMALAMVLVARLSAGNGVVPGRARIASDCRLVPGMERAAFEDAIQGFVAESVDPSARARRRYCEGP